MITGTLRKVDPFRATEFLTRFQPAPLPDPLSKYLKDHQDPATAVGYVVTNGHQLRVAHLLFNPEGDPSPALYLGASADEKLEGILLELMRGYLTAKRCGDAST